MSNKIIRAAFETRLATWAAARSPALRIAYQNASFEPPADSGTYLRATLLPAPVDSLDLAGAHRLYRGVFQVDIIFKTGTNTGGATSIADELIALFPLNLGITQSGLTVYVREAMSDGPVLVDAAMTTLPVFCSYRADTP